MKRLFLVVMVLLCIVSVSAYVIDGDTVFIDDDYAYISATPHTVVGDYCVELTLKSKDYSGDITVLFGYASSYVQPTSFDVYDPGVVSVERSFTCEDDFNYTTSPNYFWCYREENGTTNILFEHSFETGNLPQKTAYWSEDEYQEWRTVTTSFGTIVHDFDGKDVWRYLTGVPVVAGVERKARICMDTVSLGYWEDLDEKYPGYDPKYDVAFYPSSYGNDISAAIGASHFYYLDPYILPDSDTTLYWKANNNLTDESGTLTLENINSVPFLTEYPIYYLDGNGSTHSMGTKYSLAGASTYDYIDLNDEGTNIWGGSTTEGTVMFWATMNGTWSYYGGQNIFNNYPGGICDNNNKGFFGLTARSESRGSNCNMDGTVDCLFISSCANDGGTSTYSAGGAHLNVSTDTWFHVAVVFNTSEPTANDRVKFYLNGTRYPVVFGSNQFPQDSTIDTTGANLRDYYIGDTYTNIAGSYDRGWNGMIDNFIVLKRALSADEILNTVHCGDPGVSSCGPTYANETAGRAAILAGADSSEISGSYTSNADQQVAVRLADGSQYSGAFDIFLASGDKYWGFNYDESSSAGFPSFENVSDVFWVWEGVNMTDTSITAAVTAFIDATN